MYLMNGRNNMEYKVNFSEKCIEDIDNICKYISDDLKAINSSNRLRKKIIERVEILTRFPEMYPKINKYDRLRREYHRIIIDKYIILYTIDKTTREIYISHMFYGRKKLFRRSNIKF